MDLREKYKGWDRDALLQSLEMRKEEIQRLRNRTLDDYVREMIQTAIELEK